MTLTKLYFILVLLTAFSVAMLSGCTTATPIALTQQQNTSAVFKDDMQLTVNGVTYDGSGVIPKAASYNFVLTSKVDIDMLTVSSCGRDFSAQSAIKTNWLHPKRSYSYTYVPQPGVEDSYSCMLRVGAYNEKGAQNSWGLFDFTSPIDTMVGQQMCNGTTQNWPGVSMCETKVGIITRLVFAVAVKQDTKDIPEACVMSSSSDGKTWESTLNQPIECVSEFIEIAKPHALHRHTEKRYTDVLIREN